MAVSPRLLLLAALLALAVGAVRADQVTAPGQPIATAYATWASAASSYASDMGNW